jgi:uncharacterized protein YjbI with pentapeptide repeats
METLTAFTRERARWKGEDPVLSQTVARLSLPDAPQEANPNPPTDIATVLTVIGRREARNREREKSEGWRLDLRSTDLKGASLDKAHLERAFISEAHLERALLWGAHLERARLWDAHLEEAVLGGAHLERTNLSGAHLEKATLWGAHLEGAFINKAHLEGANLWGATGLIQEDLNQAFGNTETKLPEGLTRPAHWPQ